jgi:hypothetical protein
VALGLEVAGDRHQVVTRVTAAWCGEACYVLGYSTCPGRLEWNEHGLRYARSTPIKIDVCGCFPSHSRGSISLVGMAFVPVSERD